MSYRLDVPYREKDIVKALGARWNPMGKFWYCEELTEDLKPWYRGEGKEIPAGRPHPSRPAAATPSPASGGGQGSVSLPGFLLQEELFFGTEPAAEAPAANKAGTVLPSSGETGTEALFGLPADPSRYKTVTEINALIADAFFATSLFRRILVKGEVTNYSGVARPHYYFSVKDAHASLPCRLWAETARTALKFKLENGQQVALTGRLEFYEARGEAALIVSEIVNIGAGAAALKLLELKNKLEAEGIFSPEHKKPIPKHPKTVGIITSKDGQAIRDIRAVSRRRDPYVQLVLYHVNVQGKNAVPSILAGIRKMDAIGADALIVGRGGGSNEDLDAFNDEAVVRAVYAAKTPVISAVGHEGHWTLIDFAADERAATPSEAAEKAVPDVMSDVRRLAQLKAGLDEKMRHQLEKRRLRLETLTAQLTGHDPVRLLKERRERLSREQEKLERFMSGILQERQDRLLAVSERLVRNMQEAFRLRQTRWELLTVTLNGLSPTAKLVKGFGYITSGGQPLTTVETLSPGDALTVRIHDGEVDARAEAVRRRKIGEE